MLVTFTYRKAFPWFTIPRMAEDVKDWLEGRRPE
jgi:hypothetical protein